MPMNRRRFLELTSSALPALSLAQAWAQKQKHIPIGLEIYTVRRQIQADLRGTLKRIREIGYEEAELIPSLYGHSAAELKKIFADAGLKTPSGGFDERAFPTSFEYAKAVGLRYMMLSDLPVSEKAYHQGAIKLNEWGRKARDMGMRVAFHTHDDVFNKFNGVTGLDILLKETDPELVFFEMDCYWVAQAGQDPVQLLRRLGKRVRMLHLKDRKPGFPPSTDTSRQSQHFTEVGSGSIDWPSILKLAQHLEIDYYFVEQDETDIPVMESIQKSYNYLRKILP